MPVSASSSLGSNAPRQIAARPDFDQKQRNLSRDSNIRRDANGLRLLTTRIIDFAKSRRDVSRPAVHPMQKTLERAEIQFVAKNRSNRRSSQTIEIGSTADKLER
jgi:hypothetical protein